MIKYLQNISVGGLNLNQLIIFSPNAISVDSSTLGINKPANVTFFDLNYSFAPVVLKNNELCSSCTILSYTGNNLTFNVTGFSTYSTASNSKLSVSIVEDNGKIIPEEVVTFTANYSNRTSGASINGTGIGCNISFNSTWLEMNFSENLYQYNRSFPNNYVRSYTQDYNVSCDGSSSGFEQVNASGTATIELNATLLSLEESLTGYSTASLAVAEIDGVQTLVLFGNNDTIGESRDWNFYQYNGSWYANKSGKGIEGTYIGSASLLDYDKNGLRDISLIGQGEEEDESSVDIAISRMYKNS